MVTPTMDLPAASFCLAVLYILTDPVACLSCAIAVDAISPKAAAHRATRRIVQRRPTFENILGTAYLNLIALVR